MNLNSVIVHRLDKESQGNAKLHLAKKPLPGSKKEVEFISNIKEVYYKKSNPTWGIFDKNLVTYPYQTLLKKYIDGKDDFYTFSVSAMKHLRGIINEIPQATGGYVVFAHYTLHSEEFAMIVILNNKKQYNIDDVLNIEEILSLDIDKLDVANSVNITRWNNSEETYLSFAKGRKEVSNYFKRFIGCTEQTSAKESSETLKKAFLDYISQLDLTKEESEDLRHRVLNYCYSQIKQKEDIYLNQVSSMINPDEPHLFQEFASSEAYRVGPTIKGHVKTLKALKFYVYKSKSLTIEFDHGLVNESIFYNEKKNELRITNIPEDLRRQLTNTED
jgi:nucleoid-associated protein YejK